MPKKSVSKTSGSANSAAQPGTDSPRPRPKKRSGKPVKKKAGPNVEGAQRLQRLLASAGFGSRRQCEELIEAGRIDVDGVMVTKLGSTADLSVHKVRVDGVPLKKQRLIYYAVNKPVGVVTTNRDPEGRPRVVDLVPRDERVFPVGRLDRSSEGLILLTNDGELAQKLTHPKYGVKKIYRVTVAGKVDAETMKQMRTGIYIAEGHVQVEGARLLKTRGKATDLEIILREGKNREIRRILARLGHKVQQLRRIAVGPLRLGDMPAGAYRLLSQEEVRKLWESTEIPNPETAEPKPKVKRQSGVKRPTSRLPAKAVVGRKRVTTKVSGRPVATAAEFSASQSTRVGVVIGGDPVEAKERKPKKPSRKFTKKVGSAKRKGAGKKRER
jgi:23S rRNA pseudouridine2605 synthase